MGSCGVRKVIPPGEHLLVSNRVVVSGNSAAGRNTKAQILHRTNKRVLFNRLPVFLWLYAAGTNNKNPELSDSTAWRRKFRRDLGEEPVLFNPKLAKVSADNIKFYLFNKGYFDAECDYVVKKSKRKARVKYVANTKSAYLIREVSVISADSTTKRILQTVVNENPAFRLWLPCDLNALSEAEETFTQRLRDSGFFSVNASNIRYELDTNQSAKSAAVRVFLDPPELGKKHKKFRIGHVSVTIQTAPDYQLNDYPDTILLTGMKLHMNHYPLNARVLTQVITLDSGDVFSQSNWTETYRKLLDLNLFKVVEISQKIDLEKGIISPKIDIQTEPRLSFSAEPQILYSPQGSS